MNFIALEGEIEAFIYILQQRAPTWEDGNLAAIGQRGWAMRLVERRFE